MLLLLFVIVVILVYATNRPLCSEHVHIINHKPIFSVISTAIGGSVYVVFQSIQKFEIVYLFFAESLLIYFHSEFEIEFC